MSRYKEGLTLIPAHMREGVIRYIDRGIPMGSFGNAVMANNFLEAFSRADLQNLHSMKGWAEFIYLYAPAGCHGSQERVDEWCKRGGLEGIAEKETSI